MKRAPKVPKANAESILKAINLSDAEARFLVTDYYTSQEARKRADMQDRHISEGSSQQTVSALRYMAKSFAEVEAGMARLLEQYARNSKVGLWMLAQHGVGPIITAGMLAHLDVSKTETAGGFWRFSGLDPSCKWKKGEKRPYNAAMKQLCYHLGECIKRTSGSPDSFYGAIYRKRKEFLVKRNEAGANAERAKTFTTNSAEVKKLLKKGKLPAGNLDRQACNYVAKIFLSHLHVIMYWNKYKKAPPKPFSIAILGHAHEIMIPHIEMFPGLEKAYYGGEKRLEAAE